MHNENISPLKPVHWSSGKNQIIYKSEQSQVSKNRIVIIVLQKSSHKEK
jgi:hypothetical protein